MIFDEQLVHFYPGYKMLILFFILLLFVYMRSKATSGKRPSNYFSDIEIN